MKNPRDLKNNNKELVNIAIYLAYRSKLVNFEALFGYFLERATPKLIKRVFKAQLVKVFELTLNAELSHIEIDRIKVLEKNLIAKLAQDLKTELDFYTIYKLFEDTYGFCPLKAPSEPFAKEV